MCKYPQPDTGKQNAAIIKNIIYHDQISCIPGIQECFNKDKSINIIHHVNRTKDKNRMIISTDTQIPFNKV